ncbi:HET-domain-containing protein [Rostrohypoxylon terebratum]|nr:HET-domain-containing protein [Rostrohypoxylon terebratum]
MRFLETHTAKETGILKLVDKTSNELPTYAILSHTWEENEIVFDDIENGTANNAYHKDPATLASLSKIRGACIQAADSGYDYIWIDSCCIDKRSSAELSEAINSMFVWYRDAAVCYAFLLNSPNELDTQEAQHIFANDKWFTRGWTLQELLAPAEVIFFSGDWIPIGEKRLLCVLLADITGIDKEILLGERPLTSASVARRMSWAAKRVTTRPEDRAYCLMGIFSVNMPMLYGEGGEKAFIRLQEEIMKQSDDQSLFAWVNPSSPPDIMGGLLAPEPSCFSYSQSILPYQDWEPRTPYTVTNRGLRIELHLTARSEGENEFVATLDCPVPPDYKDSSFLAIYLKKLSETDEQYARIRLGQFASVQRRGHLQTVYIRQRPETISLEGAFLQHHVQLRTGPPREIYRVLHMILATEDKNDPVLPSKDSVRTWVPVQYPISFRVLRTPRQLSAAILFEHNDGERLAVMIGTLSGLDVAFGAMQIDANIDVGEINFGEMESQFEPSKVGRYELPYHSVRISSTPVMLRSSKSYMVDIDIEAVNVSVRHAWREAFDVVTGNRPNDMYTETPEDKPEQMKPTGEMKSKVKKKKSFWKRVTEGNRARG